MFVKQKRKTYHEFFVDNHLTNDRMNDRFPEFEHRRQRLHRNGIVDVRVSKKISAKALLSYQTGQHRANGVGLIEQIPDFGVHLLVDDVRVTRRPMPVSHRLGRRNDMLSHALRRPDETLPLARPQLLVERLGDHASAGVELVRGHVRYLDQHRRYEVHALEQLEVYVHVERHLPLLLDLFLLFAAFVLALRSKKLIYIYIYRVVKKNMIPAVVILGLVTLWVYQSSLSRRDSCVRL